MLPSTVIEAQNKAQGCVIWLHGLGAYGKEFTPIVPHMMLPSVRFVFPQAIDRAVTINGGVEMPAWFDIRSLVDSPTRESQLDIVHSTQQLEELIAAQNADGIPSQNIILIGFSQGGAMALHVGLRHKRLQKHSRLTSAGCFSLHHIPRAFLHLERSVHVFARTISERASAIS